MMSPASRSFTPVSASAGLLFDATDALRLGFTLSSAARAPGQTELYARGPHEATATFETGNAELRRRAREFARSDTAVRRGKCRIRGCRVEIGVQ